MSGQIMSNVLGGLAVIILGAMARLMLGLRRDFHRFMTEHTWLITTSLWTRDKVTRIMTDLGMPIDHPPPDDLTGR